MTDDVAAFTAGQQLVARIKRSSKYWGQTAPNEWFDVRVVNDASYQLRGNDNNYRLSDVTFGVRLPSGTIVDLTTGKWSVPAALSKATIPSGTGQGDQT
ncbi:MAG: hypothetical protein AB7S70_02470 [Hyphomicrobium sp.]|uniref:hypothetical protein n=1 Tax=Hyphomicrobium sp. TaxID=82 RepID=UPI003D0E250D